MKAMITFLFGAFSIIMANAQTEDKENAMLNNGIKFLDIPYVAHTLEATDGEEELIINCDEVDCTTFIEYVLAMSLSPTEDGQVAESDFAEKLQMIRYRDGKINGYLSRLHYNTDWVNNGVRNGFLEDISATRSPYAKKVNLTYMSSHPELYKQLKSSPQNVAGMKEIEKSLSGQEIYYVPQDQLPFNGLPWIKNGDIITIITNTPGLDVAHMGIAFYVDGKLSLLHASSKDKKVTVSKIALRQMLLNNDQWTGIRVLRMKK